MALDVNSILVSVIMPAFNAEQYIAESIESVLIQSYKNWELIIIDDGSTDNTKVVVQSYLTSDNRIRYIYQPNSKQGKARNKGINISKGNYLAFLDADDLWHPEKLEKQIRCIESVKADLVFSDCYSFITDINKGLKPFQTVSGLISGEEGFDLFLKLNRIPILTVLVKKECILMAGCFDERRQIQNAEDYQLWLKLLLANYKFYGMPDALAYYRTHASQSTFSDPLSTLQAIHAIQSIKKLPHSYKKIKNRNIRVWFKRLFKIAPPENVKQFAQTIELYHGGSRNKLIYYVHYLLIMIFGIKLSRKIFLRLLSKSWI